MKSFQTAIIFVIVASMTPFSAWADSELNSDFQAEIQAAEKIGLKAEFVEAFQSNTSGSEGISESVEVKKVTREAKFLRRIWLAQFQIERLLAQIDEERTVVSAAIDKIEGRKAMLANMTDSANFLSTSIIALVGNAVFIPAPPPRPTAANELFTIANGVSMVLSTISLIELQGGGAKLRVPAQSMLLPLLIDDFKPPYSAMVWSYLNSQQSETASLTPRQELLAFWKLTDGKKPGYRSREMLISSLGLNDNSKKITLKNLRVRQSMLEQLEVYLARMSRILADLVRRL